MSVITVNGTQLPYLIEGEGKPCVMLGSPQYNARLFSAELRQHIQFIFLDLGLFVPPTPDFDPQHITLESLTANLEAVRQTLNLGEIMVMGHSINGLIALEYAHQYPLQTSHLALISSPPCGTGQLNQASDAFWEASASAERQAALKANWAKLGQDALQNMPPEQGMVTAYLTNAPLYWYDFTYDAAWIWEGVVPNVLALSQVFWTLFYDYDLRQRSAEITAPIFLALGRYDYSMPYTLWDDHLSHLSNLTYHLFENSSHTPPLEESALFTERLIAWLDS